MSTENSHLRILFKHVLRDYLDTSDFLAILNVTKIEDFDIANLLGIDLRCKFDYSLRLAYESGHLSIVKYLVENGANIHIYRGLALRLSSKNGHLPVVKYLVEKGADIHANEDESLRSASKNGHLSAVKYLLEKGAHNDMVLIEASEGGHRY